MKQLRDLCERVQTQGDQFSDQDWEDVSQEANEIDTQFKKYNYTSEERQEIGRLKTRLALAIAAKSVSNKVDELKGAFQELQGTGEQSAYENE